MEAMDNPFYFTLGGEREAANAQKPVSKVELSGDRVRYYNMRSSRTSSVGAPARRPLSSHSLPSHGLSAHLLRGVKCKDMLDILMVSCKQSEAAQLWVTFLTTCFQQICQEEKRPPFKLASIGVDEVMDDGCLSSGWNGSRLQIVIACPNFMERLGCHPAPSILASLIQPATVVAMMLGVQPTTLDSHHLTNIFKFDQWRKLIVKNQDVAFVGDFLGVSMDILSRSWQLQQAINQMKTDNNNYAHFSLIPKKLKVGQNKLIVLLSDPVGTSDRIKITVDRNGQKYDISSFKRRNPYTLQFSMPGVCLQTSVLVSVNVERNGKSLGQRLVKCESRLRELEQILKTSSNPINFMCQALGINPGSREQLDNVMVASLQKNVPPHFNLLTSTAVHSQHATSNEEIPTLLHFGAKFGLEKLCWELLECPGGWQACSIRNSQHMTPSEMAEHFGHTKLSHAIKGYSQMTELSSMYSYLKGMSEKGQVLDETNYLLPRPINDTYSVPPAARPLLPSLNSPIHIDSDKSSQPPTPSTHQPDYQNTSVHLPDVFEEPSCSVTHINETEVKSNDENKIKEEVKEESVNIMSKMFKNKIEMDLNKIELASTEEELPNYEIPIVGNQTMLDEDTEYRVPKGLPTPLPTLPVFLPPLEVETNYQVPPAARPFTPSSSEPASPLHLNFNSYLHMHSPVLDMATNQFELELARRKRKLSDTISFSSDQLSVKSVQERCASSQSCSTTKSSPQDELIEIINDFKNNVFTIAEVEKLVESWRNRNDVQQSFRERQDQLEAMRQEYERIQKEMKDHMKRATPFERIKRFFSRKSKSGLDVSRVGRNSLDSVCHRPLSSLSLHSSSSSSSSTGRISTGSGASLGDSGTHSDQDSEKPTEQFVFHERLQSVRERSETSGGSLGEEYVTTSPQVSQVSNCELPLPPRGQDLSHVHAACDPYRNYINCPAPEPEENEVKHIPTFTKQETIVEIHHNVKTPEVKDAKDITINIEKEEDDEEDPLQLLEDLALSSDSNSRFNDTNSSTLTLNTAHLSHLSSSDLELLEQSQKLLKSVADSLQESEPLLNSPKNEYKGAEYINVSPFPSLPFRHKYNKSVLL